MSDVPFRGRGPQVELWDLLKRGFVIGLFLIAPLAVTVVVTLFIYNWITGLIAPLVGTILFALIGGQAADEVAPVAEFLALPVLFALISLLGILVMRGVGERAFVGFDEVMEHVPVVNKIYASARRASNALIGRADQFETVVAVEWPREGLYTIGFVTNETPPEVRRRLVARAENGDEQMFNVFVPMSPNPMGGFLALVPESRLETLELSVGEGIQMIVTTGMTGERGIEMDRLQDLSLRQRR